MNPTELAPTLPAPQRGPLPPRAAERLAHGPMPWAPRSLPGDAAIGRARGREAAAIGRYRVQWARHADELKAAQRLRWRVFADEMGARLAPWPGVEPGHDADGFDPHCEHLLVWRDGACGSRVVGTYRLLMPEAARRVGGLYTERAFELRGLQPRRARMAELGRSCVDPEHRQGAVILMLWSALARFMVERGLQSAIGCASVPMWDGGLSAARLWRQLAKLHPAPAGVVARPRRPLPLALPWPLDAATAAGPAAGGSAAQAFSPEAPLLEPPPLIAGYLRCGARLLGPPAWDADFGMADLPMLLDLQDMPDAYRRRLGIAMPELMPEVMSEVMPQSRPSTGG